MSIMKYISALTRFDRLPYAVDRHRSPVLPENPGTVHAIEAQTEPGEFDKENPVIILRSPIWREIQRLEETKEPIFFEEPMTYQRAECGKTVKVYLPTEFREDDPDACQSCIANIYEARQ